MSRLLAWCGGLLVVLCLHAGPAVAADQPQRADSFRDRFELRFGAGLHGVGSVEKGTAAFNPELVFPQLRFGDWPADPRWDFIVPRLHIGGVFNFAGRTNYFYFGGLWTYEVTNRLFVEGFLGGATHDGSLIGDPANNRAALGCRLLFHSGGSIGYRLSPQWSVMFTFDHLSNGDAVLDGCPRNQGLNEYLVRVGYSF
ncbi:MAG: acyloxyacyl hydrolase [Rhizobiales bacterium]|nr:acyloxyacyl hydrolase [Hyphomicrobiales bacterium]